MSMETDQKAALLLEDGTLINGYGLGLQNVVVGEICFNTAMTGYQETLTDPSYSGQIITFTNPHIGNVGTNDEDHEQKTAHANGFVIRETFITTSNWRAKQDLDSWARSQNLVGISGVDTRRVAGLIRDKGAMKAALINPATQENIQKAHQELDEFQDWKVLIWPVRFQQHKNMSGMKACGQQQMFPKLAKLWLPSIMA